VDECPVDAMVIVDDAAKIDDEKCIRCGRCHDVCPQEAVRHDSERIPIEVEANVNWTRELLKNFSTSEEKRGLIDRVRRYFNKEKKVAEQSMEKLDALDKEV
jgi:Fe-S-cluster-containing hydrogenase component 2